MAYPFNQYGYQPYPQIPQVSQQYSPNIPQNQQMQPQIQNGGFIPVRGEQEARNYPVAPGTSVTFKDETAPYVYTKTMGFSSLDRPVFDKFKLVKETEPETAQEPHTSTENDKTVNSPHYVLFDEFEAVRKQIDGILADIDTLKEKAKNGKVEEDE